MSAQGLRIQLISDGESLNALSKVAASESIAIESAEIPKSDQRFGLAEAAAIVAVVRTSVQIAELLAKAYKLMRGRKKITIKTPRGTVTIDADSETAADTILAKIQGAGIM